jgi:hypothetical protein
MAAEDARLRRDVIRRAQLYELAKRPVKGLRFENGDAPATGPYSLSLDEFLGQDLPTTPALIGTVDDNILPAAGLMILVGKGGQGKTTLVLDLAFHGASAVPWLGFTIARPLNVLIIENEGPQAPFRRKLEFKRDAWPHAIKGQLRFKTLDWGAFQIDAEGAKAQLRAEIEQHQIDVVCGDPLDSLGLKGVGSPENTRDFMAHLVEVGLTRDVAFILLHHPRKEESLDEIDEAAGAWGGKPDTMLKLSITSDTHSRLSFPKVRWGNIANRPAYILEFDTESATFSVVGMETKENAIRDYVKEIVLLFQDEQWRSPTDIAASSAAATPGIGAAKPRVQQALNEHPELFASVHGKLVGRPHVPLVWQTKATETKLMFQLAQLAQLTLAGAVEEPTGTAPPFQGEGATFQLGSLQANPPRPEVSVSVEPTEGEE